MPLPFHPSLVRALGGKRTWGREPRAGVLLRVLLRLHKTGARAEGQLRVPYWCLLPPTHLLLLPPSSLSGLQSWSPAALGSNQKQDCKSPQARIDQGVRARLVGPSPVGERRKGLLYHEDCGKEEAEGAGKEGRDAKQQYHRPGGSDGGGGCENLSQRGSR